MKDVIYLRHDVNACHDPKIIRLRAKHGPVGYAFWWFAIEIIRNQSDNRLAVDEYDVISIISGIDSESVNAMMETSISVGLFQTDGKYIWSDRLIRDIEHMHSRSRTRSESGALGGRPKKEKQNESKVKANEKQSKSKVKAKQKQYSISSINSIEEDKIIKEDTKPAKAVSSIQSFLNDLPDIERSLCERFIKHRKLLKKPVASIIGLNTFLGDLKRITEDQALWPVILDQYEQTEWQSVKWIKLEDIPSTEPIPLGYRLAAMRCGAKTDAEIRKLIPKFEGLNPDFVGLWFWHNKVVPDAENIRTLPNWIRDMKVEKNEIRKVYAKHKAEGVRAILEKSIEFTKTKL